MNHRTIVTSARITALFCRWLITFILLLELTVLPHGMRALAAGTGKLTSGKQAQSTASTAAVSGNTTQLAAPPQPPRKISLRPLDLSRAPTEQELRMAGQLGSPLTPSRSADPAKIADPGQRKQQENDNLLFGQAIQKWNQHKYPEAIGLFPTDRLD